jgi:hypothetical protein
MESHLLRKRGKHYQSLLTNALMTLVHMILVKSKQHQARVHVDSACTKPKKIYVPRGYNMWVCLNNSFLSIVQNRNNLEQLLVRSRRKGDIEKVFPEAKVIQEAGSDYRYRAFINRDNVANAIAREVSNIDYGNFKNSVRDHDLHDAYSDFWLIMYKLQEKERTTKA